MSMSDQPPAGNPEQPQPGGMPSPSQPYYQPTYPQPPTFPPPQPAAPYPPTGVPYPPPSQPYQPGYQGQPFQPQMGYPPPQTGYPPGFGPAMSPMPQPPAQNTNVRALIIGSSAVILILALFGSVFFLGKSGIGPLSALGATPTPGPTATLVPTATPMPTPTLTVPNGFSVFTASDGSYRMGYPSDWLNQGQSSNGVTAEIFGTPDASKILLTLPDPNTVPPNRYSTLLQSFAQGLGGQNVAISAKTSKVTLGANTWNKDTGSMVFQGSKDDLVFLGTDHTTGTFIIIYFAPASQMKAIEKADFTPMVASFQFLR